MCLVEVAGVSTRLSACFSTCASKSTASQLQACHYGCRDLAGGARLLSNSPGTIYCTREPVLGRVVMSFVEVAGVSTRLSPYTLAQPSHSHACHSVARAFPELRLYWRGFPGSSAPGISCWWRCHAFGGSGRREYKDSPPSLAHVPHSALPLTRRRATTAAVIWQEVRAYSPTFLGLSTSPDNPFWPRGDVFRGSGRREYKAQPVQ